MKGMRKVFAGILVLCLLMANIPTQTLQATDAVNTEESQISGQSEVAVKSLTCRPVKVLEGADGSYVPWYDPTTREYLGEWFQYHVAPVFDVEFTDGTIMRDQQHGVIYNGQYYHLTTMFTQSYENPWEAGKTYTVTANLMGVTTEFKATVVETPIQSIEVESMKMIVNTNGGMREERDRQTNELIGTYFHYELKPTVTVTFKDGSTLSHQTDSVYYNGKGHPIHIQSSQSYANQWGVGKYTATATVMGVSDTFDVVIEEFPIESIEIEDVEIIENTNGNYCPIYDPETGMMTGSFYHYEMLFDDATVYFKDGTSKKLADHSFEYNGDWYRLDIQDPQNMYNQWGVGEYEVTASVAGASTTYKISIVKAPYVTLEILNVAPVYQNENCYYDGENVKYNIPAFSYKVTSNDGTSFVGYYDESTYWNDEVLKVSSNQEETPWTAGGKNTFTVSYHDLTQEVPVNIIPSSSYEYYEEDGEIYITDCKERATKVEIPSMIDSKPVVGILDLGSAMNGVEELVIPDSVRTIAESFLGYNESIRKITIGSGVAYLDLEMFVECYGLEEIVVSEQNPNYCSVDGILYDKNVTTVIAYPMSQSEEYQVPASVTDFDVMNREIYGWVTLSVAEDSVAFVEEDGVIYNANKTKVISCDKEKAGTYEMPETVTEIAEYAFFECSKLTEVTVSKNVTDLAYCSFWNCTALKKITLPTSLETISDCALSFSAITEMVIPDSVTEIGREAFCGTGLETVSIGKGVKSIGSRAFAQTTLKSITIPDNVTTLKNEAFAGCMSLESAVIGSGVSTIEDWMFIGDINLKDVTFKGKIVDIGSSAFEGCILENVNWENVSGRIDNYAFMYTGLTNVTLPNGVTEIAYSSFGANSELASIDVPETLIRVGTAAVSGTAWYEKQPDGLVYLEHVLCGYKGQMPNDTTLTIKEGTKVIADMAFDTCKQMKAIELPDGLQTIGAYAFENCTGLTQIDIPASVQEIGDYAFENCFALTAINVDPDNQYYTSIDGVLFNKACTKLIYCPIRTTTSYVVPDTVTQIEANAFNYSDLNKITIKNSDTELGYRAIGYNLLSNDRNGYGKYLETTIVCPEDSLAHEYAKENLIPFELMEPTETVRGFEITATTTDKMYMGEEVTLQVTVKNISGKNLKPLRWFNCWYYREDDNSETYPGIAYGTLADAEGTVIDSENFMTIPFEKDETKTFTYKFEVPETWTDKSSITFVVSSTSGLTNYYGQENFQAGLDCAHKKGTVYEKIEATCTTVGREAYTICDDCKEVISGENKEIPMVPHNLTEHKRVEPTHLAEGHITYWECGKCKQWFSDEGKTVIQDKQDVVLDKTSNHDESGAWTSDAENHWKVCGCGEKILTDKHAFDNSCDTTCNVCEYQREIKHTWKETYSFDANGHWIECSVCGEKEASAEAHQGGKATCQAKAECSVCKQAYGSIAPHEFTKETVDAKYLKTAATCVSTAVYYKNCTMCGKAGNVIFNGTQLDANNHTGKNHIEHAKAPTCQEEGYTGDTYCECQVKIGSGKSIAKLPHEVTEWTVSKKATVYAEGEKTGTCNGCKKEFIVYTEKLVAELKEDKVEGTVSAKVETVGDTKLPGESVFVADDVTKEIETEEKQVVDTAVDKAVQTVESVTEEHKIAAILDLKIIVREYAGQNKDEAIKETEHEPEGKVRVTVEIPKTVIENYENIILLHIKDDGSVEEVPFTYVNGTQARFDTDGFSYYVFVGSEKPVVDNTTNTDTKDTTPTTSAKTGDENSALVWGAIMMLAMVSVILVVVRKRESNR